MAIDLSSKPELLAAQNSQIRKPLIDLVSNPYAGSIPFVGQYMTATVTNEKAPVSITHSSGRIVGAYINGTANIDFWYTDVDRQEYTHVLLTGYNGIVNLSICELDNGNIGFVILRYSGGTWYLDRKVITIEGTAVNNGNIGSWANATTGPTVINVSISGSGYMLSYVKLVGTDYTFYLRTSSDFVTWSAETAITIGGRDITNKIYDPFLVEGNGALTLFFAIVESVGPSGEELSNIYHSISDDEGVTWGNVVKDTSYTTYAESGYHPYAVVKNDGSIVFTYTQKSAALHMDRNTTGWCTDALDTGIHQLTFNDVTRKLYAKYSTVGVVEIDVDSWEVDNCWNCATTPGFNSLFCDDMWGEGNAQGVQHLIPVMSPDHRHIAVLNADTNTITTYSFDDNAEHGVTKNVSNYTPVYGSWMSFAQIDFDNMRLWVMDGISANGYKIGWIDLTDVGPTYTVEWVVEYTSPDNLYGAGCNKFLIVPEEDYIIVPVHGGIWPGALYVHSLADGSLVKRITTVTDAQHPRDGMYYPLYFNGKLYASFDYVNTVPERDKRGLCIVNLSNWIITYSRPVWATLDEYALRDKIVTQDDKIIMASQYGVTTYSPDDGTWELINNASLPGLSTSGTNQFYHIAYDASTEMIFSTANYSELCAFSRYGYLKQTQYMLGDWSADWVFGEVNPLILSYVDYDSAIALEPTSEALYAFWEHKDSSTEYSIKWDKDSGLFSLKDYLSREDDVTAHWSIDGSPHTLEFCVSHGHLFDQSNLKSLYTMYLKKGRKITLRYGEEVSGVEYWQNKGVFVVIETGLSEGYERGIYPKMTVKCEDLRCMWDDMQISATAHIQSEPVEAIKSLLIAHTNLTESDFNFPTFDESLAIDHQWIDESLHDIINQIADRFRYYIRIDENGNISARKIGNNHSVDHAYANNTKLVNYTPDDSYSDFTNRVTVIGQEPNMIEVMHDEERVSYLNGTHGWHSGKVDYTVYYSTDKKRRVRFPRIEIPEGKNSVANGMGGWLLGDVTEEISFIDPEDLYCIITVETQDLSGLLWGTVAAFVGFYMMGDKVVSFIFAGWTIPVGSYIRAALSYIIFSILGAQASFQYEIYGMPVGTVRRHVQATEDDTELQREIGFVVPKEFEDALVQSVAECLYVAQFEIMVAQMQRRRMSIRKVADLRDEDGDTITFPHPYTGDTVKFFVTELTRKLKIGTEFVDELEGWRI